MYRALGRAVGNPFSIVGVVVTTVTAVMILTMFVLEMFAFLHNPYIGIVTYLILPVFFVIGLLLIPFGIVRQRRRDEAAREAGEALPVIDFNRGFTRRVAAIVLVLTVVNVVILATATVKGVHTMDTVEFCGSCHSVMHPEVTAYRNSPHARVRCVDCHIGPGADWFVKSKLSGAWQVVSVALDLYPKPIPTPIHNLRPARDTCEQCHWPEKFVGDRLKVLPKFEHDEENTELTTVLLLRVGGIEGRRTHGIHWHVSRDHNIRYLSDESRETIYDVELTEPDGTVKLFRIPGAEANGDAEEGVWRTMDCIDCHNRPTHIYGSPDRLVASAIKDGRIPSDLPFVARESIEALTAEYSSHEQAREQIAAAIEQFYRDNYPEIAAERAEAVRRAAASLSDIYATNVFPAMNVTWNTYPDHIGHERSPGCFRCHDDEHQTDEGELISQDCSTCHSLLAWEEQDPEILATLKP
jgi:hypothetical protein